MSLAAPFTYILLKNNVSNRYKTLTSVLLFRNVAHLDFICCFLYFVETWVKILFGLKSGLLCLILRQLK